MSLDNLRIVGLQVQNIMRLRAVEIKPKGDVIVIGGNNEQGKTSLLESIAMAFGGTKAVPELPVRKGASAAIVVADLGDIIITRSFKEDSSSSLEVKSKEGARFPSPQKMLEELVGRVCFDPISFIKLKPPEQLSTVKELVGLDFSALDVRYANAYGKRTDANRELKRLEGSVSNLSEWNESLPTEPLDAVELSRQIAQAESADERLNDLEVKGRSAADLVNETTTRITTLEKELADAKVLLEERKAHVDACRVEYSAAKKAMEGTNLAKLQKDLQDISERNSKILNNNLRKQQDDLLALKRKEISDLEKEIGDVAIEKEKAMTAAKFPIPGLSFNDTGLLYNGTPFDQASAAAKLRTSLAMGIALNPKIRVMIIRDGSLLDEHNLSLIKEMAAENNVQVWIERVGDGEECTVVIDDGEISEDRTAVEAKPKTKSKTEVTRRPLSAPRAK